MRERYDVAVIGGGPAGAATAIVLSSAGFAVALVERRHYDEVRIGETLPPAARRSLAQLGVWERFRADGHAASPGTLAAWGDDALQEHHRIANPYGNGWHLDRARFDALLSDAAREAGACVSCQTRAMDCRREGAAWRITTGRDTAGGEPIRARVLVDATGRVSLLTRALGAQRLEYDRLVGVLRFYEARDDGREDFRTMVEAAADGWWYSALLPNHKLVVAYMTDADLLPRGREGRFQDWDRRLGQTSYTRGRIGEARVEGKPWIRCASSGGPERIVGASWLAVGDAAMTFDPLSSQGIYHALESGIGAGRAIGDWLTGGVKPFDAYTEWMEGRFATYLKQRQSYYARERRWPRREFWRRRHAAPQGSSGPSRCESSPGELGDAPRADRGAVVGQGYPTD